MLNTLFYITRNCVFWILLSLGALGCQSIETRQQSSISDDVLSEITQRAEARWRFLIAKQWDKAYEYESPAYRAAYTLEQFRNGFGSAVVWRTAKVNRIVLKDDHTADVYITLDYQLSVPGLDTVEQQQQITERWAFLDKAWWYVRQK